MFTNADVINAFTTLDEIMQSSAEDRIQFIEETNGYEYEDMFELGKFYEWAKPVVDNENIDLEAPCNIIPWHAPYITALLNK